MSCQQCSYLHGEVYKLCDDCFAALSPQPSPATDNGIDYRREFHWRAGVLIEAIKTKGDTAIIDLAIPFADAADKYVEGLESEVASLTVALAEATKKLEGEVATSERVLSSLNADWADKYGRAVLKIDDLENALAATTKQRDEYAEIISTNQWPDTAAKLLREATARAEAAESALETAQAALQGWQPIETAPKDGSAILVYPVGIFGANQSGIAYWDRDEGYEAWRDLDGERIEEPPLTHWQHLPEPPAATEEGE